MPHTITIAAGQKYMEDILQSFGVPSDHAQLTAEIIMESELRGYADHGIAYLNGVVTTLYERGMNPKPDVTVVQDNPTMTLIDGDGGIGTIGSTLAMKYSIEKAAKHGIAMAGVRNSIQFVAGVPYVTQAVEAGMIAFVCSNTRSVAPPTGGLTPTFGTNPLAYGVPAGKHPPMLLDFSTTATSMAKVLLAGHEGEKIEEGLVMHPDGRPLTDPNEFDLASSLILPSAGAKGYGLMMMVDILSGVLTGSGFGTDLDAGKASGSSVSSTGHFMWVIDPAQFMPRDEFLSRMDRQIEQIKGGKRLDGVDEIFIPGERGMRRKMAQQAKGELELPDFTWAGMEAKAAQRGVPMPEPVS